jgi:hypothetical protein
MKQFRNAAFLAMAGTYLLVAPVLASVEQIDEPFGCAAAYTMKVETMNAESTEQSCSQLSCNTACQSAWSGNSQCEHGLGYMEGCSYDSECRQPEGCSHYNDQITANCTSEEVHVKGYCECGGIEV